MALILKDISKSYGKKAVISNLSYAFDGTGSYALLGESGAGKTTLLRIIAGLDKDYCGTVEGNKDCSFAFQEYRLFPRLCAIDNIILPTNAEKNIENTEKAKNLLKQLGFKEEEMLLLPDELSGGMKQRVSLARAFFANAPILLLDEPTKELDPALCSAVNSMIKAEAKRRTVIIVTHRTDDIAELQAKVIDIPKI